MYTAAVPHMMHINMMHINIMYMQHLKYLGINLNKTQAVALPPLRVTTSPSAHPCFNSACIRMRIHFYKQSCRCSRRCPQSATLIASSRARYLFPPFPLPSPSLPPLSFNRPILLHTQRQSPSPAPYASLPQISLCPRFPLSR